MNYDHKTDLMLMVFILAFAAVVGWVIALTNDCDRGIEVQRLKPSTSASGYAAPVREFAIGEHICTWNAPKDMFVCERNMK